MTLHPETVLFAGHHEEHEADARQHIKDKGFTQDDVRLVIRDKQVLVIAKRSVF